MRDYIHEAKEQIDAAMFSGDGFVDPEERKSLREMMARWERGLKEFDNHDFPETLTLVPCNCEYNGKVNACERSGFEEGHFSQGCGFSNDLAAEIKRRYDNFKEE